METKKLYYIGPSKIHGSGVMSRQTIQKNQDIDIGIDFDMGIIPWVTPYFGSWINHSYAPNCRLRSKNGKWYVTASKKIPKDQEILLDYRMTPWYIAGPKSHYV